MNIPSLKKKARIEIIPLIDIVFFLLATFIMVSLAMVKNDGISVALPDVQTGSLQPLPTVTITVKKNGELYLDQSKVTLSEIATYFRSYRHLDQVFVIINGDKSANFGDAVKVLDEIRQLGITKVAIRTRAS